MHCSFSLYTDTKNTMGHEHSLFITHLHGTCSAIKFHLDQAAFSNTVSIFLTLYLLLLYRLLSDLSTFLKHNDLDMAARNQTFLFESRMLEHPDNFLRRIDFDVSCFGQRHKRIY